MLDSMPELDPAIPAIRRGIVDLDENNTSDKELADLNAAGVRGIRVNISPIRQPEAGLAASMLPRIGRLAKICGVDAPPTSDLPEFGNIVVQVGNS